MQKALHSKAASLSVTYSASGGGLITPGGLDHIGRHAAAFPQCHFLSRSLTSCFHGLKPITKKRKRNYHCFASGIAARVQLFSAALTGRACGVGIRVLGAARSRGEPPRATASLSAQDASQKEIGQLLAEGELPDGG